MQQDNNKRPAHITPSRFKDVMTGGRGGAKFGKTAEGYAEDIVQLMMGVDIDHYVSRAMEWGTENEPFAIDLYQEQEVTQVHEKSRFMHPEYDFISGEPDGLIADDGLIEVKCPNSSNHFKNLRDGEQIDKYMYQMQGYMWITDREWCDFCSYDPRYPEKYQLYVETVERDQEIIDTLEERCIEFWDELVIPIKEEMTNEN